MRYIYSFFMLLLLSCNTSKKIIQDTSLCEFNQTISKEEMTFDLVKYNKEKDIIYQDENFISRYYRWQNDSTITNKQTNKQTKIGKWLTYYPNGNIETAEFIYLYGDTKIGNETHYDKQGNITKIINHDKGYTICWAQALEIVKHKKPTNYLLGGIERTQLTNEQGNTILCWVVGVQEPNKEDTIGRKYMYYIDGTTGKFIKKVQYTSNPG